MIARVCLLFVCASVYMLFLVRAIFVILYSFLLSPFFSIGLSSDRKQRIDVALSYDAMCTGVLSAWCTLVNSLLVITSPTECIFI